MTDESPKRPKESGVTSNAKLRAQIEAWEQTAEKSKSPKDAMTWKAAATEIRALIEADD